MPAKIFSARNDNVLYTVTVADLSNTALDNDSFVLVAQEIRPIGRDFTSIDMATAQLREVTLLAQRAYAAA